MPVLVNLRLLERNPIHLEGAMPAAEWLGEFRDELVRFDGPMEYDLEVVHQASGILATGKIATKLVCACSRCLKEFPLELVISDFAALLEWEGDESVQKEGDFVDLTPRLREDTFLALPTKPLCKEQCRGLLPKAAVRDLRLDDRPSSGSSPWSALDKFKF